ncbi:MAG TPA: DUF2268 domain-containing putative Zn-dependent protease [Gammaproteobacteria bacterium]
MKRWATAIAAALFLVTAPVHGGSVNESPADARIVTEDVDRFWKAWDVAARAEDANSRAKAFFNEYYLPASPGLRDFIDRRIGSVFKLVETIDGMPRYYASLREYTPIIRESAEPAREAFRKFEALYPGAVFPDVYVVIGRASSGGTTGPSGLLIGAEMFGGYPDAPLAELDERGRHGDWLKAVLRPMDQLPHIIAHELVHYQQADLQDAVTLLEMVYREGSADFVAELISGRHINHKVHDWALPREREIWQRFAPVMESRELHGFLYNRDVPEGWPADTGYFIGYRIAEAYYDQAEDKRQALADILTTTDVKALLEKSGYAQRFK